MSAVPKTMWTGFRRTHWLQYPSSRPSGRSDYSQKHLHLPVLGVPPERSCILAGNPGMRHEMTHVRAWNESKRRCLVIAASFPGSFYTSTRSLELWRERVTAYMRTLSFIPRNAAPIRCVGSERLGTSLDLRSMLSIRTPCLQAGAEKAPVRTAEDCNRSPVLSKQLLQHLQGTPVSSKGG